MASDTVAQFEAELSSIVETHKRLAGQFETERVCGPRTINRDFIQALSTLHMIAQFIKGDFDARVKEVVGKTMTKVIFHCVQQHFADLDRATKYMEDTLNTIKEEDLDLLSGRLAVLKKRVTTAHDTSSTKAAGLNEDIETQKQTISTQRNTVTSAAKLCEDLKKKLEEDEKSRQKVNIGLSILVPIWGIAGLIDKDVSPGHVVMGSDLSKAQKAYQDAVAALYQSGLNLQKLEMQFSNMESEKATLAKYLEEIGTIEINIKAVSENTSELFKDVVRLSIGTSNMLQKMSEISGQASVIVNDAYSKSDYAQTILEICHIAINEPQTVTLVTHVVDELVEGYDKLPMPLDISETVTALRKKIDLQTK